MQEEKNVLTKNAYRLLNNENAVLTVTCTSICDVRVTLLNTAIFYLHLALNYI